MNRWVNIEVSADDEEIAAIDRIEGTLGELPQPVARVRELISRFESCHFKCGQHYQHIIESIVGLSPAVEVEMIGIHHPRFGEQAAAQDTTGRSRIGRNYILALQSWVSENPSDSGRQEATHTEQQAMMWLGDRDNDKVRLVRFLLARLQYKSVEEYRLGGRWSELEFQAERIDTCHYTFPRNLDLLLQGIGTLKALPNFEGCGFYSTKTERFVSQEFVSLCEWLETESPVNDLGLGPKEPFKIWLVACLAKTIKESVNLSRPIPRIAAWAHNSANA